MSSAALDADHHFRNPPGPGAPPTRSRGRLGMLRWMLSRRTTWPRWIDEPARSAPERVGPETLAVTFVGHSTFLVQLGGVSILTDPIFSRRASPFFFAGPARVRAPGQLIADLPGVDLVLVSHCHYDHLDLPSLRRIRRRFGPRFATPLGNSDVLAHAGIRGAVELDWWQAAEIAGVRVTAIPARHFSARTLSDRNRRLWAGFVFEAGGQRACFVGDSGDGPHFAEIGARLGPFDLALIPIGAYAPRDIMRAVHVDPDEAVAAHVALRARRSIGMHFGTFQLTDEPIGEPEERLRAAVRRDGLADDAFVTLAFGETRIFR